MSEREAEGRVGVRELRQNLSIYLDRVKEGESLQVTEHGRPVARLIPARQLDTWDQMVADGRITLGTGSLTDLPMPEALSPETKPLSVTLIEMRDEERW